MTHSTKPLGHTIATKGRTLLARVSAAACLLAIASPVSATPLCLPHSEITELLDVRFSEARIAGGVASGGGLVEVFSTADGNTWTIVITTPKGMSCVVSAGEGWHRKKALALGPQA